MPIVGRPTWTLSNALKKRGDMSSIVTNTNAAKAESAMMGASQVVQNATAHLATGSRILSAADDSAGLAISTRMSSDMISLNRAMRNANDGVSMLQTADSASGDIGNALVRMRQLALQAANGTYTDQDRGALSNEFSQLREHISNTVEKTLWNGRSLLDGSMSSAQLQIGATSNDAQTVDLADFKDLQALSSSIGTAAEAKSALDAIDESLGTIDSKRVQWGAAMNRLVHAGDASANINENLSSSRSKILDTDYAKATAELAKAQILQMAGKAMLSQANQAPISVLRLLR